MLDYVIAVSRYQGLVARLLSNNSTRSPCARSECATLLPMKPTPPVINV